MARNIQIGATANNTAAGVTSLDVTINNVKSGSQLLVVFGTAGTYTQGSFTISDTASSSYENIYNLGGNNPLAVFALNTALSQAYSSITITLGVGGGSDSNMMAIVAEIQPLNGYLVPIKPVIFSGYQNVSETTIDQAFVLDIDSNDLIAFTPMRTVLQPNAYNNMNHLGPVSSVPASESLELAWTYPNTTGLNTKDSESITFASSNLVWAFGLYFAVVPILVAPASLTGWSYFINSDTATNVETFKLTNIPVGAVILVANGIINPFGAYISITGVSDGVNTYTEIYNQLLAGITDPNSYTNTNMGMQIFMAVNTQSNADLILTLTVTNGTNDFTGNVAVAVLYPNTTLNFIGHNIGTVVHDIASAGSQNASSTASAASNVVVTFFAIDNIDYQITSGNGTLIASPVSSNYLNGYAPSVFGLNYVNMFTMISSPVSNDAISPPATNTAAITIGAPGGQPAAYQQYVAVSVGLVFNIPSTSSGFGGIAGLNKVSPVIGVDVSDTNLGKIKHIGA